MSMSDWESPDISRQEGETFGQANERILRERRERSRHAGEVMAEPIPTRVLAEQSYTVPNGSKEAPPQLTAFGRWFGRALGGVLAVGSLLILAILMVKGIIWAWSL